MKTVELSKVENGSLFKIGTEEFIKFFDVNGETIVMPRNIAFRSRFGNNNDLRSSDVLRKLQEEYLPKIIELVGEENVCEFETDLTTLDGLKPYGTMKSKISLPTLDFYRQNVETFDKYKVGCFCWLATPESAQPHSAPDWVVCVAPSGDVFYNDVYHYYDGVRPFLHFVSSISVSCED